MKENNNERRGRQRLVVVLGMHRSGTSAITRGLQVMGVELGNRLMPPVAGNNDKGFWEDLDIVAFNDELLAVCGRLWHSVEPIQQVDVDLLCDRGYVVRAIQLLRDKLAGHMWFGFKDPRTAIMLPFWVKVFRLGLFEVRYVLALRNPLSIISSLARRDHFVHEKSYILWVGHVLASLKYANPQAMIAVDYDRLMRDPDAELYRVACWLGSDIDTKELSVFRKEFLDETLRHTQFDPDDIYADVAAPMLAREIHGFLSELLASGSDLAVLVASDSLARWSTELERVRPALRLVDKQSHLLHQHVLSLHECEGQIAALNQSLAERESEIACLNKSAAGLMRDVAEREGEIASLRRAVNGLMQDMAKRDQDIVDLKANLVANTQCLKQVRDENSLLRASTSWRLTRPLRSAGYLVNRIRWWFLLDKTAHVTHKHHDAVSGIGPVHGIQFDADFYRKMYPDIRESGINPEEHFLQHGMAEGRLGYPPALEIDGNLSSFNEEFETVLVVSHEASLTGAPILSLNIVQQLASRYNVVALLLGGGVIGKAFRSAGAVVVKAPAARGNGLIADATIQALSERVKLKFALVNSVESRWVLPALFQCGIPAITLIHEFAAYTRPKQGFGDAVFWSAGLVFSADITFESARKEFQGVEWKSVHVLPQGRCFVPKVGLDENLLREEWARVVSAIRPPADTSGKFVVLGAGFVQLRKGVDVFIQCAAKVIKEVGAERVRFVWMGSGFDPDGDVAYSVYLADQIERAGLKDSVVFVDETLAIEAAYQEVDALLLSSRLDPLPNVAIDAMAHGVPVVCFEKTTGIAAILQEYDLGSRCVAKYLDTEDMAQKLVALMESRADYEEISARFASLAANHFDMSKYVAALENFAVSVSERLQQEKQDVRDILDSDQVRVDFSASPHLRGLTKEEFVPLYVRGWASGAMLRKPVPGFHPGVYIEHHREDGIATDPFADYLRKGCPEGPWKLDVIKNGMPVTGVASVKPSRVAIHLHVFYEEVLSEFLERIGLNAVQPDLWISVPSEELCQSVKNALKDYRGRVIKVSIVPNRGRDIGPMLTEFGFDLVSNYDVIGHFHTKASKLVTDANIGRIWNRFILENLVGGLAGAMADLILREMEKDESIGLVFPDDPNVLGWSENRVFAEVLARRLGIDVLPNHFNFPIGTMFWARSAVLKSLVNLDFDWSDYPDEPLGYDGTILHAIERLMPMAADKAGLRCVVTNVEGVSR